MPPVRKRKHSDADNRPREVNTKSVTPGRVEQKERRAAKETT